MRQQGAGSSASILLAKFGKTFVQEASKNGSPGRDLSTVTVVLPISSIVRRWLRLPMSTCSKRDYPHETAELGHRDILGFVQEGVSAHLRFPITRNVVK